jgi:ribosomal-protein-alanine N-acetyltransferase
MDDTFLDSKCPYCGNELSFPASAVGTLQECLNCSQTIIVGDPGTEVAAKLPVPIQTPRLLLRRMREADAEMLLDLMSNEESFQYINWEPMDAEQIQEWLSRDPAVHLTQPGGVLSLILELTESAKAIGLLTIFFYENDQRQLSFTLLIAPEHRRQGFGTEAVFGAAAFAFEGLRSHRIVAECHSLNQPARAMLEKAGLRREGEGRKALFQKGEWVDVCWYAMLKTEYDAQSKA